MVPKRWKRIDLQDVVSDVDPERVAWAKEAASNHPKPVYPALQYTETEYLWVLLYEHIHFGQIRPEVIRRMKRSDIEYLAGHPAPHPELLDPELSKDAEAFAARRGEAIKIVENVSRAARELERRNLLRAYSWTTAVGAAVGGLVAVLAGRIL